MVLGVVAFFALQAGLNLLTGLGRFPGRSDRFYGVAVPGGLYPVMLLLASALSIIGIPLSGLLSVFGEDYGWRGYLQDELARMGGRWGAVVVRRPGRGLVWGVWHIPVILSGSHTYPPTALGVGLGMLLFVLWGIVQSYAVVKAPSIWVAAFLHGLVNSVYGFILQYLAYPEDEIFSFGLGIFGLACLAIVVVLALRGSVWNTGEHAADAHWDGA